MSQNCALNFQIFFFFCLIVPYAPGKKLENVCNLENALEHSVCKKSEAKCEGVSFPGGVTDFILCCAAVEHFFPDY